MRLARLFAILVLLLLSVSACGLLGTHRSQPVAFVNRTGQVIVFYQEGRRYPALRTTLAVDERLDTDYLDPQLDANDENVKFRVEATTTSGALLFCHDFTWKEFGRLKWVVEIRVANECT